MAKLPTPNISGQFNSANTSVSGNVTWANQSNLSDLDQMRVRYVRLATSQTKTVPSRTDLMNLTWNPELSDSDSWRTMRNGSGQTTNYQYRDDIQRSSLDRNVPHGQSGLTGFYCWGMSRLEV